MTDEAPRINLSLEDINAIVQAHNKPKVPKTIGDKIRKTVEKKAIKGLVSVPSFVIGFAANSSPVKHFFSSLF